MPAKMTKKPNPPMKIHLPFFFFLLAALPSEVISQPPDAERSVLLNLRQQWGNPAAMAAWNSSSSPCDWPEVQCSGDGASVTGISLRDREISVEIPAAICGLKNLSFLDLALNYIPGEFPGVLYGCSNLRHLDLSQNLFVGTIPGDIDRLSGLRFLDLSGNNFSGDVPKSIGRISELRELNLHMNLFNGTVPSDIGSLANLEYLRLAYNGLLVPAAIPPEFGKLKNLKELWMKEMNLVGNIPESFSELSSLEKLDLSLNNLEGEIPNGLFLLENIRFMFLYHNKLSGEFPKIVKSVNLSEIDISMNNLVGPIPDDLGKLSNLTFLLLYSNRLSGAIPESLGLISTLRVFRVFKNKLNGTLPPDFGLNSKLEEFEVSENQLTGRLPENLCRNAALRGLIAFSNNLAGELPKGLGECDSLETIHLYGNKFSGEIPSGLWRSRKLATLMISNNSFSGELPAKLPWNMSRLEISNNQFSGELPKEVTTWEALVVFKASNNRLSGKIPSELTSLSQLTTLLLDGNRFSGELPEEIISWKSLDTLNLSENELSGPIPKSLGSLPHLLYLDLSGNHLSGEIPDELGRLILTSLNLSSNNFSGKIPTEFDNLAYDGSFLNNPNLCSASGTLPLLRPCGRAVNLIRRRRRRLSSAVLAAVLTLAVVLFLATLAASFLWLRRLRRKKHSRKLAMWKLTSFQRLDFTEYNVVKDLTEGNLIGSGGSGKVYRVSTNRAGEFVAVKRISNSRKWDKALEREFLAEVRVLGMIRHSNIVKLLCCVSGENSKLLVYEYMENRSLDVWLHGKKKRKPSSSGGVDGTGLDWPTRLRIAIGAAQGLSYMHHDCSPPVLHRDVKSSNILLNSEFRARVADFGLARILARHGEPHTVSAIAGSFGYIAPEYAYMTRVDEKIDVYSFGVVLLELATGREPSCEEDESMSLAEWAWQHYGDEKPIVEALDEDVVKPCYLEEMTTLFKLGLMCTSTSPSARPSMQEVLQILRRFGEGDAYEPKRVGSEFDVAPLLGNTKYLTSYKCKKISEDDNDETFFTEISN